MLIKYLFIRESVSYIILLSVVYEAKSAVCADKYIPIYKYNTDHSSDQTNS